MGKGSLLERLGLVRKPLLSVEQFRERVVEEVLRRRPGFQLERAGESELAYGPERFGDVARGYQYYRETPRELDIVIGQLADMVLYEPERAKAEELILLVRPESFEARDGERGAGLALNLPGGLIALVAVDTPSRYVFTTAAQLREDLGMDDAAIWNRARSNLRQRIDASPPKISRGKVLTIETGVGLASSLLAEETFWTHPNLANAGDLVVLPLERDQLIIVSTSETELIHSMRRLAATFNSSEFLCGSLLLRRNGAWEDFE